MAVCLHCLHANRVEARTRRRRAVIRFTLWTMGVGVVGVVGAAGADAVVKHETPLVIAQPTAKSTAAKPTTVISDTTLAAAPVIQQGSVANVAAPMSDSSRRPQTASASLAAGAVADSVAHAAPAPPPAPPSIAFVVPPGRTNLADSLFAVRSGDTVVVHFDTSPARTRRADKFERIVRQTLHAVYGAAADTLLASVPGGRLAANAELVSALPTRGIHLGPGGRRVTLWPETRPGRDGPLVVAYRTAIEH